MTDRELLELAARAYWGEEIDDVVSVEWSEEDQGIAYTHGDNQDHNGQDVTLMWNPLNDGGDALRLAVKLELNVRCYTGSIIVDGGYTSIEEHDVADRDAATRRAIVRAAAEVGRSMSHNVKLRGALLLARPYRTPCYMASSPVNFNFVLRLDEQNKLFDCQRYCIKNMNISIFREASINREVMDDAVAVLNYFLDSVFKKSY